jgi:hypothetical protein
MRLVDLSPDENAQANLVTHFVRRLLESCADGESAVEALD